MRFKKKYLGLMISLMSMSLVTLASVSYAAFTESNTISDPNMTPTTDLAVKTDMDGRTIRVSFYCTTITSGGNSLYIYDKTAGHKFNYVQQVEGSGSAAFGIWKCVIDVPVGTPYEYRYFTANTNDQNDSRTLENNSYEIYRSVSFNDSSFVQNDKWQIKIKFGVRYNTGGSGDLYIVGGFTNWGRVKMSCSNNEYWWIELPLDLTGGSDYYQFKYWTDHNGRGFEGGNNRSAPIESYLYNGCICGYYDRTTNSYDSWQS